MLSIGLLIALLMAKEITRVLRLEVVEAGVEVEKQNPVLVLPQFSLNHLSLNCPLPPSKHEPFRLKQATAAPPSPGSPPASPW